MLPLAEIYGARGSVPKNRYTLMEASCPDCRSHALRRRKRSGFTLYFVSMLGQWPYRCEECGSNFLLKKRYLRANSKEGGGKSSGSSRESSRPMLIAPIGGVAAEDAARLRARLVAETDDSEI
jgi:DNA-directed RNA polymerase subunit RPC12/RpoP